MTLDPKKVANNILDFLIDPTRIPVKERVYFGPEENLQNAFYENAKADAFVAYRDQKHNSDFYPLKNRSLHKEALMDRRSLIASLDVLSKNFKEDDPISVDLRSMAVAVSKMQDEELSGRMASEAPDLEGSLVTAAKTFKCPDCGTNVLQQTGYCVKCKKKVKQAEDKKEEEPKVEEPKADDKKEEKAEEKPVEAWGGMDLTNRPIGQRPPRSSMDPSLYKEVKKHEKDIQTKNPELYKVLQDYAVFEQKRASDEESFWSKEASDLVAGALVMDVVGAEQVDEEPEPQPKKEEKESAKACPIEEKKEEEKESAKACPIEEKKEEAPVEEKKENKEAGKIKGPGVPDGTGPMKDSPLCPFNKEEKKENNKEAGKIKGPGVPDGTGPMKDSPLCPFNKEEKKEEKEAVAPKDLSKEKELIPPAKESTVVDTGVLASIYYEGIEIPTGLITADEVGELSTKEKEELSKLF